MVAVGDMRLIIMDIEELGACASHARSGSAVRYGLMCFSFSLLLFGEALIPLGSKDVFLLLFLYY